MPREILTPSRTRELLEDLGHRPRQRLGQNFLIEGNIVRKSLELARIHLDDTVVEVGPGLGTLTGALLQAGAEVWAVEADKKLFEFLYDEFRVSRDEGKLHLMHGDAVELPLAGLDRTALIYQRSEYYKIVANLPYAISSVWLDGVLEQSVLPERMVLMLQKEAADRYTAEPGSKSFGAISVFLQLAYEKTASHRVSKHCFYPQPDIDSVLLRLERRDSPALFSTEMKQRIRGLFQQRRKQIGSLCRGDTVLENWIQMTEVDPKARAEAVPLEQWGDLKI